MMTGKEALEKLSNHCKANSSPFEIAYIQKEDYCKNKNEVIECLDTIKKDFWILDVFKSIIKIVENDKYTYGNKKYIVKLRNDVILNDALLEIIKEWLKDDK